MKTPLACLAAALVAATAAPAFAVETARTAATEVVASRSPDGRTDRVDTTWSRLVHKDCPVDAGAIGAARALPLSARDIARVAEEDDACLGSISPAVAARPAR